MGARAIPTNKFEKLLKEQQHQSKLDLLEQVCESIKMVFEDCKEDPEPWCEVAGSKEFRFKKLEFIKGFGVIHLHYCEKDNPERTVRLSLELKRA